MAGANISARVQSKQPRTSDLQRFALRTERLGPLPLINHFIERLGLEALLDQHVPTTDPRCAVPHARTLGVLLRSIIVEREPIYRQQEVAQGFAPELYGLSRSELGRLDDDRIGRALDRLFVADRAALLTDVVVAAGQRFALALEELHNDSTSVAFCGQYRNSHGSARRRGVREPWITYGFSKNVVPGYMWRQPIRGLPPSRASVCAAHISASATARAGTP